MTFGGFQHAAGLISNFLPFVLRNLINRSDNHSEGLSSCPPEFMKYFRMLDSCIRMIYVSANGVLLYANALYADWYKAKTEHLIGSNVESITGKIAFRQMKPRVDRVLRGRLVHYTDVLKLSIGRQAVECFYLPMMNPDRTTNGWFGLISDWPDGAHGKQHHVGRGRPSRRVT